MLDLRKRQGSLFVAGAVTLSMLLAPTRSAPVLPTTATAVSADVDSTVVDLLAEGRQVDVVVRTVEGATAVVRDAVEDAGARVFADLPLVNGFAATITVETLDLLKARHDVVAVTADHDAEFQGSNSGNPKGDSWFEDTIGADALHAMGIDGEGVGIAIVDSGVTAHPTLTGALNPGVNVSGESSADDSVGHGTFLAGLAVGSGATSPNNKYDGVAPGAHVIPVKVGGTNGVSLIALLQGLQWIHFNKDSHGIDVVNLSFGTRSPQSFSVDPLNFAVQRLWADGLVVIVAAGNLGADGPQSITKPGDDPFVITVGSLDSMGTQPTHDDVVPTFSSRGPTLADGINKPDLVAPGRSLIGPVAPGSAVALMTDAHIADGWVRASGTSMSTAVVSGAAALLLQAHPDWTPGQVKGALLGSAAPGPVGDPNVDGHGVVDVAAAAAVSNPTDPNAGIPFGTGTGSLNATLGDLADQVLASAQALPVKTTVTKTVTECVLGICVNNQVQVQVDSSTLEFYDPARFLSDWTVGTWAQTQWTGNQWWGNQWWGNQWWGNQFYGNQWWGNQWWGNQWLGNQWLGNQWWGNQWLGNQWWGQVWSGNQWWGNQWWGNQWLGNEWYGNQWWGNQWWSTDWS